MMEDAIESRIGFRARRWAAATLLLVLAVFFLRNGLLETWGYVGFDFEIFLEAAQALREDRSPYSEEVFRGEAPPTEDEIAGAYIYPAFFARLLIPITHLPPWPAKLLFILLTGPIVISFLFPWKEWRRFFSASSESAGEDLPLSNLLLATVFLLCWGPLIENLRYGQSNLLILVLFILAWRTLPAGRGGDSESFSRRELLAGALVGMAAMIKLTPLLAIPIFATARRWGFLLGFGIGAAAALAASGWEANRQYFAEILPVVTHLTDSSRSIDLSSVFDQLLPRSPGDAIISFLFLLALVLIHRGRERMESRGPVLIAAFLIPVFTGVWFHHHLSALLPLTVLFLKERRGDWPTWKTPAVLVALLPGFTYWPPVAWGLTGLEGFLPLSRLELFTLGQALAFFLLLPDMIGRHERDHPTD